MQNDAARCFHCKTDLYQLLDGLREPRASKWIADGTNLDDLGDDRPGIKAAREWGIRSPLVEASLSKSDVRALAQMLGLSNWNKPAAACLSSRIPRGIPDHDRKAPSSGSRQKTFCMLKDFTICAYGSMERSRESRSERMSFLRLNQPDMRAHISARLRKVGFRFICVDLEGYRPGGVSLG